MVQAVKGFSHRLEDFEFNSQDPCQNVGRDGKCLKILVMAGGALEIPGISHLV
ncbi:hypothetical protein I79_026172 [Cricetulus griseus]|uniref:Uncharacterized protein n=1 Tax=Cricetulus griseus TaxID=10029 RepID=G3IQ75_CRIGR|nr:hypothetical protein I79_026172 [Cricetulus griseus]